ncbi:cell filamentation protein Fic [Marinomonas primoryensis]|uniref:Cell filamentation protein Fic n=1 Tax=Marinomonas primoryensis TaxID=178399 RepID=A0A2Z4PPJ8_9GAMM|nr:Fic family protein [Marinomonas primoryensis]AWX99379.1 cell filamentation protein Fic [Marinomonas primoryensis]
MSKNSVEKAPEFDLDKIDFSILSPFIIAHKATDDKGRYLHWDKLKWRVPRADAENIWLAVKFHRVMQKRTVNLTDEKSRHFSYIITHSMEEKLHKIIKFAEKNTKDGVEKPNLENIYQKFILSSFMKEEAITSAQLEGASTTSKVAKKMLEEERAPLDEDERMILNNFLLLKHTEKKSSDELTVDLILEFHRIATNLTTENNVIPGEFRQNNDIYVEDKGEIAHQPPCYSEIPYRLQKLCDFANTDHSGSDQNQFIDPVIKAIILHFMIGYEHPFRDGNGRTARALFYWFMLKNKYELFRYISISKLLKSDPKGYGLSYMYTEKDQNDLTYFIDFQLDIILSAFGEWEEYLKNRKNDFNHILNVLEGSKFNSLLNNVQKDIINRSIKEPGRVFTAIEIANSYFYSENTARSYLSKLVSLKLLLETKDGRTKLYIAPYDLMQRLK